MSAIEIIVTAFTALVGALGGGSLLFFRQNKTAKKIENESNQAAEWKKLYDESKSDNAEKEKKIDGLYDEIKELRSEITSNAKRIAELEVENTRMSIYKCELPGCKLRKPPTGY